MMRVPIWAITLMFVASMALAAPPSLELPVPAPQPERPELSEDWSLEELVLPAEEEVTAGEVVIARKRGKSGGHRGGARHKNRGGFSAGNHRHANRHVGEPGRAGRPGDPGGLRGGAHRDVDVHRDVDIDRDVDFDDDDDEAKAALLGGVIGLGVGAMIADQPDPGY
jgi:hypothetical protein